MSKPWQGEIWTVDLNPVKGHQWLDFPPAGWNNYNGIEYYINFGEANPEI